jgi:alanyl-tRNA synthetase
MTSAEIRRQFLDFFVLRHGHTFVPSSPVVPLDDPTLLFTNAGMNQFKPIFLGQEKRAYTRAANTQKCIRAGGKHNDLDDVGRSRRHHTFFEMLGNWSFGDYFKRGAIEMAWELLTKVWKIDPTRLHATCYEGDEKNGIPRDEEAARLWKEIAGLPDGQIHFFGKENFWEMGDTGPCGPCSEIHIDRTPDRSGGKFVNGDDPRVMEIWNLVFIQYNRDAAGKLTPLPAKHVDTGMGFERICQVLQGKEDNYATDLWSPLFDRIGDISGFKYGGKFTRTNVPDPAAEAADEQLRHDIAFRVIADHARCLTFALTDGAMPSNEGRGYVLRRILRRAVFWGRQHLNLRDPFLINLVPTIVETMGSAFPELRGNPSHVIEIIRGEELSFGRTIEQGLGLFGDAVSAAGREFMKGNPDAERYAKSEFEAARGVATRDLPSGLPQYQPPRDWARFQGSARPQISGANAFILHATYGFPVDLTLIMAQERGMAVDVGDFRQRMERHNELSRAVGQTAKGTLEDLSPELIQRVQNENLALTDDSYKFSGDPIVSEIIAISGNADSLQSEATPAVGWWAILLDRTNFYTEMGGQIGDSGSIETDTGAGSIVRTVAQSGYIFHIVRSIFGSLKLGQKAKLTLDRRSLIMQNHTGTHLANWALREVLGDGVQQKGSLVDSEKLRFDFSHAKAMADEEVSRVEELVNREIAKKLPVYAEEAAQELALKINGLRAVFGEKYPPKVRVVSIGAPVKDLLADPANPKWRQFSIEFCGGTHLKNSAEISQFVVTAEESVSKGIRRLVAVTGESAASVKNAGDDLEKAVTTARAAPEDQLPSLINALQKSAGGQIPLRVKRRVQAAIAELQAKHKAFEKSKASRGGQVDAVKIAAELLAKSNGKLIVGEIPGAGDEQLRAAMDSLKKKSPSHAIMLASAVDQKVTFVAAVSDDLIAKGLKAGDWVKQVAAVAGGGGGGRPQMAQGSGKDPSAIGAALEKARELAKGAA